MFEELFRFKSNITPLQLNHVMTNGAYDYFTGILKDDFLRAYKKNCGVIIDEYTLDDFQTELNQGWFEYDPVEEEWIVWLEQN